MFSKILVALDHGDTCAALFEEALTLAQSVGAKLMLLTVLTSEGENGLAVPSSTGLPYYSLSASENIWAMYQENFRQYEAKGLERLRMFKDKAQAAGLLAEFTQTFGSPGRVICNLAKTWEADLVMVGSHGRKGLSEIVLGSVSNYVMHHAPCSVLITKISTPTQINTETADLGAVIVES